jgi:enoyl reductase-like protein
MTPAAVLRRMVALLAIGRGGDYDDGRWLDPSYRQRVRDMALRFEQRLAREPGPSMVGGLDDLDDPEGFVARFVARYPEAERLPVGQADADFFVHRVCARPASR